MPGSFKNIYRGHVGVATYRGHVGGATYALRLVRGFIIIILITCLLTWTMREREERALLYRSKSYACGGSSRVSCVSAVIMRVHAISP